MRRLPALLLTVALATTLLAGCGDDEAEPEEPATNSDIPVPDGVELTDPGTELDVGEPATAVYVLRGDRGSVVRVTVTRIRKGKPSDFRGFSLDPKSSKSIPWYVQANLKDVGEAGLGGSPMPLFGLDSGDTFFPPADVQGFDKCAPADPPKDFGPGDTERGCLVFFVPKDLDLVSVQLRAEEGIDPISWPVP